jgi:hypothetical protein
MSTIFDKINTKEIQTVWDENLEAKLFIEVYIKHASVFRQRQGMCDCYDVHSSCN